MPKKTSQHHARHGSKPIALSRKELYQRVWSKPLSVVARDMGVSGTALAKICNRLLVPYPSRGHWSKVNVGKQPARPPLPAAPESQAQRVTISSVRAGSRRAHTRLPPEARREQLIGIAAGLIREGGLHAASMKRIAAAAGISETQAYNYFSSREHLFVELARREFVGIRAARESGGQGVQDHYAQVTAATRAYLRQIGQRGDLLQTLLGSQEVRNMLRTEHRQQRSTDLRQHAENLVELYKISWPVAMGCTAVLSRLCIRAGKIIAEKRLSVAAAERLCLSMVLQGSRTVIGAHRAA